MHLLLRAIITGFGYKLGAEIARYAATRVGLIDKETAAKESTKETIPDGITTVPGDDVPDDGDGDADGRRDDEPN
ncbi:MAG: hypothetical protein AAF721_18505 [Myxococcota bacterium]